MLYSAVLYCNTLRNAMLHYAVLCCVVCAVLSLFTRPSQDLICLYNGWSFCKIIQLTVGSREVLYSFLTKDNKYKNALSVVRQMTTQLFNYLSIDS